MGEKKKTNKKRAKFKFYSKLVHFANQSSMKLMFFFVIFYIIVIYKIVLLIFHFLVVLLNQNITKLN